LADVPDEAFAAGAVGKGVGIDPDGDTVVAPGSGTVMAAFPTGHAVGIKLDGGVQVLIHIGIDTVNMEGRGFELLVSKGDRVEAGQPLVRFDRAAIEAAGYSPVTPVLVTNHKKWGPLTELRAPGAVRAGEDLLEVRPKVEEPA
ncbi:PTS glucose transporter subunit IIA, partial [Corynebacterium mastitidis]